MNTANDSRKLKGFDGQKPVCINFEAFQDTNYKDTLSIQTWRFLTFI